MLAIIITVILTDGQELGCVFLDPYDIPYGRYYGPIL